MMRVMIVDDEAPARSRLARKLSAHHDVTLIGEASNGVEALEKIETLQPDIVFLDIEMPELDGLGVAQSLNGKGPMIVFVTAYDEFALKAFESCAVDYLVKPVSETRLTGTLERLRRLGAGLRPDISKLLDLLPKQLTPKRTAIRCGAKYIVIDPSRITAVVARDHYAAILIDGRELLVEDSLDKLADRFQGVGLLRAHRSALINLAHLLELQHEGDRKYLALLNDPAKTKVPISRERLPDVKRALGLVEE